MDMIGGYMKKEKCKICGKEYKNLTTHVQAAHKISMDEYNTPDTQDSNKVSVTQDELQKERFSIKDRSNLLSEFLKEFEITEKEFVYIVYVMVIIFYIECIIDEIIIFVSSLKWSLRWCTLGIELSA